MPITPLSLTPVLDSNLKSVAIAGSDEPNLARSIATAFPQFLKTIPVTTVHTGILGSGVGTGGLSIDPASGVSILLSKLQSKGLNGVNTAQLAKGIAQGLAQEINTNALVQVTIAGTSTGTGSGTLFAAEGSQFVPLLSSQFKANGIKGPIEPKLSQAIGEGVGIWMKSATITTVDAGTPVFPYSASSGAGQGIVF